MNKLTDVKYIAVHCAATPPSLDWGVDDIRRLHQNAFHWKDIGYHYVIRRDGTIEKGRADDVQGAHVKGFNDVALGVCLVGGVDEKQKPSNNFTAAQMWSLEKIIRELKARHPAAIVQGHRDFPNVDKQCPCFDVKEWLTERGV